MQRPRFSREQDRHLRATRAQILRCLDIARLVVMLGFRELSKQRPQRPKRGRKAARVLSWAAAASIAMAVVNSPERGIGVDNVLDLVHVHAAAAECCGASDF